MCKNQAKVLVLFLLGNKFFNFLFSKALNEPTGMDAAVMPAATPVRKRPKCSIHKSTAPASSMYLQHTEHHAKHTSVSLCHPLSSCSRLCSKHVTFTYLNLSLKRST